MLRREDLVDDRRLEDFVRQHRQRILVHALGLSQIKAEVVGSQGDRALGCSGAAKRGTTSTPAARTTPSATTIVVPASSTTATSICMGAGLGTRLESTLGGLRLGVLGLGHGLHPVTVVASLCNWLASWGLLFLLLSVVRILALGLLGRLLGSLLLGCLVAILVLFSFVGNLLKLVTHLKLIWF